ncbi:hypothetical protein MW887_003106 [Aspergillus wentii]|nr:hypothetical protein MW887_003106 [Aspergillus wentii]
MEEEGFLRGASIPATIHDAMIACNRLGVPYLWVDRLCILQDEGAREEAKIQINAMGDIYGRSHVTLVALEGTNADHGLPGVSNINRAHSPLVKMPGAYLVKLRESYSSQVSRSTWATRGWTFQEALLSPRLLLFAPSGVFFEGTHHNGTVGENGIIREKHLEVENPYVFLPERETCRFSLPSYRLLLQRYTKRALTFDSDALDAMSGILHTQYGTDHYYGIPFSEFSRGMLWSTDGYHNPRVPRYDDSFPSWSWLSVKGEIDVPESELLKNDGLLSPIPVSLAVWAIPRGGSGEHVRIIRDSSNACLSGLDKKLNLMQSTVVALERRIPRAYRLSGRKEPPWEDVTSSQSIMGNAFAVMIAWKHGCFAEKPPQALLEDTTWGRYEKIIRSKWSSIRAMSAQAHGITAKGIKDRDRKFPNALIRQSSHPGRLLVYTQFLRLRPDMTSDSHTGTSWLRDERGNTFHLLNGHTDHGKIAAMKDRDGDLLLETIALSLETVTTGDSSKSSDDSIRWQDSKGEWLNRFVTDFNGNSRRMELNVKVHLMVLQTFDGISRRVGIAEGYLKTWISAEPRFGTFVLE